MATKVTGIGTNVPWVRKKANCVIVAVVNSNIVLLRCTQFAIIIPGFIEKPLMKC